MNKELAKTLTTALVQFIDRERPEGTMCCSNGECELLEKRLEEEEFTLIESYLKKKFSRLTEFQNAVRVMITEALTTHIKDGNGGEMTGTVVIDDDTAIHLAEGLLELAKKEICKGCDANLRGYVKGREDAEKRYNESVTYHLPIMPTPPSGWGCDGTHCTNPHMDCINCPIKTTGGITSPNTASGTSTATLHGNTSITDGKEHNPSFTD